MEQAESGTTDSTAAGGMSRRNVLRAAGILAGSAAMWSLLEGSADARPVQGPATRYGPALFFTAHDIPRLQLAVTTPALAPVWQRLLDQAEQFITPTSPTYADPALLTQWPAYRNPLQRWLEILGVAFQLTGDARFGDHGRWILVEAAQRLTIDSPSMSTSQAGGVGSVAASLAMGYDWLAEGLTTPERTRVENTMVGLVQRVLDEAHDDPTWRPHHNFMGYAVGGVGLAAVRLHHSRQPGAGRWVQEASRLVEEWFEEGIDEQGAGLEGVYYLLIGLTYAVRFLASRGRAGARALAHPHLQMVPHYLAMSLLPGAFKQFDARNDSLYVGLRGDSAVSPVMLHLAEVSDNSLGRWMQDQLWPRGNSVFEVIWASEGGTMADPRAAGEPLAEHFEGRGLAVFRTGWQQDSSRQDVMFSMEAGPFYPTTHSQGDKGHFTLYGYGHKWAIDSAYANNNTPGGRAQTAAHNCVLIDDRGQGRSGAGLGTSGSILLFSNDDRYGYTVADCTDAYRRNIKDPRSAGIPPEWLEETPMRHAYRHTLFVRAQDDAPTVSTGTFAPYVVIVDDIQQDDAEHDYVWQMLTNPGMNIQLDGGTATFAPGTASARMTVTASASTTPVLSTGSYTAQPVPSGSSATVPTLKVTARAVNPQFVTVLAPRPGGVAAPVITIEHDEIGVAATVVWPGRTDTIRIDRVVGSTVPSPVLTTQVT